MIRKWWCWRTQRLLGPYRDRELPPGRWARVDRHLSGCLSCGAELAQLERLSGLLRTPAIEPPGEVWQVFWPRVRERLSAGAAQGQAPFPRAVRWWPVFVARPRLAMSSAALALALVALGTWQGVRWLETPVAVPPSEVVVRSVESGDPNSSVMVFSHPEAELTVVWVFGLDQS